MYSNNVREVLKEWIYKVVYITKSNAKINKKIGFKGSNKVGDEVVLFCCIDEGTEIYKVDLIFILPIDKMKLIY